MDRTVENLVEEWANRWPSVSGSVVIELFSNVAMQSWSGAEALIDAYMELEDKTGEGPSPKSIDKEMYMKLSQYWSDELTPEQLNKLDVFLSRVNVYLTKRNITMQMHSEVKQRHSFLALLFASGDLRR